MSGSARFMGWSWSPPTLTSLAIVYELPGEYYHRYRYAEGPPVFPLPRRCSGCTPRFTAAFLRYRRLDRVSRFAVRGGSNHCAARLFQSVAVWNCVFHCGDGTRTPRMGTPKTLAGYERLDPAFTFVRRHASSGSVARTDDCPTSPRSNVGSTGPHRCSNGTIHWMAIASL